MAYTPDPNDPFNLQSGGGGGGGFGMNPLSLGLQAGTALLGAISGSGAANQQKNILKLQRGMLQRQVNSYDQFNPMYQQALQRYGQNIGMVPGGPQGYGNAGQQYRGGTIGMHGGAQAGGVNTYQNQFSPNADNGYLMGPYAQQAYRLRSAANEQNLGQQTQNQDQNLMYQSQQRGLASGSAMAALAREHQGLLQDYANSQRNLAINAGPAEQQQIAQYMGLMGPEMGQGQQAVGNAENLASVYGNQAQQGFGAAGQTLGNLAQQMQMQQYMNQMNQGGMNPYMAMFGQGGGMNYGSGSGAYGIGTP